MAHGLYSRSGRVLAIALKQCSLALAAIFLLSGCGVQGGLGAKDETAKYDRATRTLAMVLMAVPCGALVTYKFPTRSLYCSSS